MIDNGKLVLQTNIPEEVAFRFPDGLPVKSKNPDWPDQVLYTLIDGQTKLYADLGLAEKIRALALRPGERCQITRQEIRNGQRRSRAWEVKRVDPPGQPGAETPVKPPAAAPAPSAPSKSDEPGAPANGDLSKGVGLGNSINGRGELVVPRVVAHPEPKPNGNGERVNGHAAANGIPYWDPQTEMVRCYEIAIQVAMTAEKFAAERNYSLRFTSDDVRQIAATLYIDAGKDRRCPGGPR